LKISKDIHVYCQSFLLSFFLIKINRETVTLLWNVRSFVQCKRGKISYFQERIWLLKWTIVYEIIMWKKAESAQMEFYSVLVQSFDTISGWTLFLPFQVFVYVNSIQTSNSKLRTLRTNVWTVDSKDKRQNCERRAQKCLSSASL